jgi:hypothetical protein
MDFPGYASGEYPDETRLSEKLIRNPYNDWTCGICGRQQPANTPCVEWSGTLDGQHHTWRSCVRLPDFGDCPIRYASWPLWEVTFTPSRDWPDPPPPLNAPYTTRFRAESMQEARARAREQDPAPNFTISVKLIEEGRRDR